MTGRRSGPRVVVVGAGVVGASVAASAAQAGAAVTLLEGSAPGGGTSATSFAWVNANGKEPEPYFALNWAGLREHQTLAEGGRPWFSGRGHLEVAVDEAHERRLAARVGRLRSRGYGVEELTARQAQDLEPGLRVRGTVRARVLFPEEGHVFPSLYVAEMLARARAADARIRTGVDVVAISPSAAGGAVVRTRDGEEHRADVVVSAAGRWTTDVAALAGVPVPMATFQEPGDVTVGYLGTTEPVPAGVSRIVTTPRLNLRPAGGGRLLLQALDLDATADPRDVPGVDGVVGAELTHRVREVLPGDGQVRLDSLRVGQRVMPGDGLTIAGRAPGADWLYVVATHSGVTLAPLLGRGVTTEILGGHEPLFEAFRPERFTGVDRVAPPRRPGAPGEQ